MKELVLIGGHPEPGGEIYRYMAEKARAEGEIGYIAFASDDPEPKIASVTKAFDEFDIKVRVISNSDECYGLNIIYLGGGDPEKLVDKLKQTEIDQLLRPHWKKGDVVLSGSSAGAMALFWDMLREGSDTQGETELVEGMGPMGGGFVVPHWDKTDEHYKEKLAEAHPDKLIIGIDENTAMRWRNGVCDVLGAGSVEFKGRTRGIWHSGEEFDLSATR